MSDFMERARAEAWIAYRNAVNPNPRHADREHVAFLAGWNAALADPTGAEVQAVSDMFVGFRVKSQIETYGVYDRRRARAAIAAFLDERRGSE